MAWKIDNAGKRSEYLRERRKLLTAAGLCVECKNDSGGRSRCRDCAIRNSERVTRKYWQAHGGPYNRDPLHARMV